MTEIEPGAKVWYHGRLLKRWGLWEVDHVSPNGIVYLTDPMGEMSPMAAWRNEDSLTLNSDVIWAVKQHDEAVRLGDDATADLWRNTVAKRTLIDLRDVPTVVAV